MQYTKFRGFFSGLSRGINCSKHYEWVKTSSLRNSKEEKVLHISSQVTEQVSKKQALKNWKHSESHYLREF